jgi:hypothetical protein
MNHLLKACRKHRLEHPPSLCARAYVEVKMLVFKFLGGLVIITSIFQKYKNGTGCEEARVNRED